ncbi:MAG: hypothetical protein ACQPRI_04370 [Solitalea-like symbiont of Tyrophagus putrescentiae]
MSYKDQDKYFKELFGRQEEYAGRVRDIYADTIEELIMLALHYKAHKAKSFKFSLNKQLSFLVTRLLRALYSKVYAQIQKGIQAEWDLANRAHDSIVQDIFGKKVIENDHMAKYFSHNQEAMKEFFRRKDPYGGLNLSQRVWKYTGQLRQELENALNLGIGQGVAAHQLATKVKQFLRNPDTLFRRVKVVDEDGNESYKLSETSKDYRPGQGVYRSAFKNAMRLTRTETNMAYHAASHSRWQQMEFVVGFEVRLSNNHTCNGRPFRDICDDLAGTYPKGFKFVGWHPQCRCYAKAILCSDKEMEAFRDSVLDGGKPALTSIKQVTRMPGGYEKWMKDNRHRAKGAKTIPYFIKDNYRYGNIDKGLKKRVAG